MDYGKFRYREQKNVITSYSIHYTKLYDVQGKRRLPDVRQLARAAEPGQLLEHLVDVRTQRLVRSEHPEIGVQTRGRITSYNVCYTKLLRHHKRPGDAVQAGTLAWGKERAPVPGTY